MTNYFNCYEEINKGAYEPSTSFATKAAQPIVDTVNEEAVRDIAQSMVATAQRPTEASATDAIARQANHIIQQFSTATLIEQLFKQ